MLGAIDIVAYNVKIKSIKYVCTVFETALISGAEHDYLFREKIIVLS